MAISGWRRSIICVAIAASAGAYAAIPARAQQAHLASVAARHHHASASLTPEPGSFERARAAFPAFCQDWERKLKERERNALAAIQWTEKDGWETGVYMGYTPILTCECHQSAKGFPVGALTYSEVHYYLAGHTLDEAKGAKPQPVAKTDTTELFRWDTDKWVY